MQLSRADCCSRLTRHIQQFALTYMFKGFYPLGGVTKYSVYSRPYDAKNYKILVEFSDVQIKRRCLTSYTVRGT